MSKTRNCPKCGTETERYLVCYQCSGSPITVGDIQSWNDEDLKSLRYQLNMNTVKSTREEELLTFINSKV